MDIHWRWSKLPELTAAEMHAILAFRQQVFVVEQNCAYQDADALDLSAWHLAGRRPDGRLVVYLRINAPGSRFAEASIGRLLTAATMRGQHLASRALKRALRHCATCYPEHSIRIAAQTYLIDFYNRFGFRVVGPVYEEDGIDHIDMIRSAAGADVT